jgi:ParB/RepB/Spo0J family partition protein
MANPADARVRRTSSGTQVKVLEIGQIEEDPGNERKRFDGIEQLASSIDKLGIVEPITVHESAGRFQIVTGHRRFRAAKTLQKTHVEAIIVKNGDGKVRLRSLASNIQREALNPVDMARALQYALGSGIARSQKELAAAVGKDITWVSGVLRIAALDAELLGELESIPNPPAYDCVIRIARIKDRTKQRELVAQLRSGATVQDIRRAIGKLHVGNTKTEFEIHTAHGFTARVTGPENNSERMLEAVSLLIKKIRHQFPSQSQADPGPVSENS